MRRNDIDSVQAPTGSRREDRPDSKPTRAGRPRDRAYEQRILQAGYEELSLNGLSHFSVAAVARRAGVARGSVYLRWPTREDLIADSASMVSLSIADPAPGPFEDRLRTITAQVADVFSRPDALRVLLRIDADREMHPVLFRRIYALLQESANQVLIRCIRQAQSAGEIRTDISPLLLTRTIVGGMFVEALAQVPTRRIDKEFLDSLVRLVVGSVSLPDSQD